MRHVTETTRTALTPNGTERVYECWNDSGLFAGVLYEMLESELAEDERKEVTTAAA